MKHSNSLNKTINQAIDNIKINPDELEQLTQARKHALSEPKNNFLSIFTTTVIAYASVFLVVGIIMSSLLEQPSELTSTTSLINEEFALIMSHEPVEMYEDLDFYMWLDIDNS